MDKTFLLNAANQLIQPSENSSKEFSDKLEQIVTKMNTRMLARKDIMELVGDDNIEMMKDNHSNHARFMLSIFTEYNPHVLVDTVLWVFKAYRSRNFSSIYWSAQLNSWLEVYKTELSKSCLKEILPFYQWMQVNIPIFNTLAEKDIDAPLSSH